MKRIKDVAAGISRSIAVLLLILIMHVVTAHAEHSFSSLALKVVEMGSLKIHMAHSFIGVRTN